MIRLPLCFSDHSLVGNIEADFLVVDVPVTYNVILERPVHHYVKAIIAPYLLQVQYEVDDSSMGRLHGD